MLLIVNFYILVMQGMYIVEFVEVMFIGRLIYLICKYFIVRINQYFIIEVQSLKYFYNLFFIWYILNIKEIGGFFLYEIQQNVRVFEDLELNLNYKFEVILFGV